MICAFFSVATGFKGWVSTGCGETRTTVSMSSGAAGGCAPRCPKSTGARPGLVAEFDVCGGVITGGNCTFLSPFTALVDCGLEENGGIEFASDVVWRNPRVLLCAGLAGVLAAVACAIAWPHMPQNRLLSGL